jgi:SOS-response transcriptional repressor LexA
MAEIDFLARLRVAVALIGKQKDAAAAMNISGARLSNYLRGVNKPGRPVLASLAALAKVRPAWLIGGGGPMLASDDGYKPAEAGAGLSAPPSCTAPAASSDATAGTMELHQAIQAAQAVLASCERLLTHAGPPGAPGRQEHAAAEVISADDYDCLDTAKQKHFVALLGRGPATQEFAAEGGRPGRGAEEYVFAPGAPPGTFAVRVGGTSMMPDLPPGSIALVGARLDPVSDCPRRGLVLYEDERGTVRHTVKMVSADTDGVRLQPLNPRFQGEQRIPGTRVRAVLGVICRLA